MAPSWTWDESPERHYAVEIRPDGISWNARWYDDRAGSDQERSDMQTVSDFCRFGPRESCPPDIEAELVAHFGVADPPWRRPLDPRTERLLAAAAAGDTPTILALLGEGIDVDARGKNDVTALMTAVSCRKEETVLALLAGGADAGLRDRRGSTALANAETSAMPRAIASLAAATGAIDARDPEGRTALFRLADSPMYLAAMQAFIAAGADVDAADAKGQTPLMRAARANAIEIVDLLLRSGADVAKADESGRQAVHYAAWTREPQALDRLLRSRADANAADTSGRTPLMSVGSPRIVRTLLGNGARVSRSKDGFTPLLCAVSPVTASAETVDLLLAAGDDPNARSVTGTTVLMLAARANDIQVVRVLLACGADLEARDAKGMTALHHALHGSRTDTACLLIERGLDPSAKNAEGVDAFGMVWKNDAHAKVTAALNAAVARRRGVV